MSAIRGLVFASVLRENSGGIVSTPLMRPLRRSASACALIAVVDRVECPRAGGDRVGQLAHPHRRHAVVLIDDADLQVLDVPAERVAEDHQLHERERPSR